MEDFQVKDSGARQKFDSGMVRDTQEGKIDYWRVLIGPMFKRLAVHVTKGAVKYPDVKPGVPNWTLAEGEEELARFKASAFRHFVQWMNDERDEDHAAAVHFNINGAEYVKDKMTNTANQAGPERGLSFIDCLALRDTGLPVHAGQGPESMKAPTRLPPGSTQRG